MADVVNINKNKPHFAVMGLCLLCAHRWMGLVIPDTSLFELECPKCGGQQSFASFIPQHYLNAVAGPRPPKDTA